MFVTYLDVFHELFDVFVPGCGPRRLAVGRKDRHSHACIRYTKYQTQFIGTKNTDLYMGCNGG